MKIKFVLACLLTLLICGGCGFEPLSVREEKLIYDELASVKVGSPDPRQENYLEGSKIIVKWAIPSKYLKTKGIKLVLELQFVDGSEKIIEQSIGKRSGFYVYEVTGESYQKSKGIAAYNAQLVAGSELIAKWEHQMWASRIKLN